MPKCREGWWGVGSDLPFLKIHLPCDIRPLDSTPVIVPPTPETPLRRRTVFWRSFTYVSRHRSSSHAERWPASKLASYGDTEIVSSWRQQRHQQVPAATSSELRAAYTFFSLLYLFNTSASRAAAYKCTEYRPWSLATVRPCGFRKRVTFTFDLLTYASMHAERLL